MFNVGGGVGGLPNPLGGGTEDGTICMCVCVCIYIIYIYMLHN